MNATDIPDLVDRVQRHVREAYVIERDAAAIAASLDGVASKLTGQDQDRIAELLTEHLQHANGDRHLRVRSRPDGGPSETRYAAEAPRNAGGIRQVRLLDGNVGLLEIAPYMAPVHLAEPYITAAFALLAAVEGLVIDLRAGRGGTPETVAHICGHLLGTEPVHLQDIVTRSGPRRQFWTSPSSTRVDGPIRVLTSEDTFSGCEELAYNLQAQQRAEVVGETTRGGAHPVESIQVAETLELTLPTAMSVNAVTGTNWERVGVVPDRACAAADALRVALL